MSANDRQVGGDHYRKGYQHWDFVVDCSIPYLEAQVTKYISRHEKKNGKQDLDKALHFLQKIREVERAVNYSNTAHIDMDLLIRFLFPFEPKEASIMSRVFTWKTAADLQMVEDDLTTLISIRYPG